MSTAKSVATALGILALILCPASPVLSQSVQNHIETGGATGVMPYNTYGGVRENINLTNGNVNLQVPLVTLPGRNGHNFTLGLVYDSAIWPLTHWVDPYMGDIWQFGEDYQAPVLDGVWRLNVPTLQATQQQISSQFGGIWCYTNFILTLSDGSKHWFKNKAYCFHFNAQWQTVFDPQYQVNTNSSGDGGYILLDTTNSADAIVRLKDGSVIHFVPQYIDITEMAFVTIASTLLDTDGNKISIQGTSSPFNPYPQVTSVTDTAGRAITITYPANAASITYKDSSGTSRTINLAYASVALHATFAQPAYDAGSYNQTLLSTLTLPNNLTYSFQYNQYAELTKVTYPTGGYTRYDYGAFIHWREGRQPDDPYGGTAANIRQITARKVCRQVTGSCATEDVNSYTPTIDGAKTNNQFVDGVDPDGNKTRYEFSYKASGPPAFFSYFSPRELNRWVYQGQTTLLRTIHTDYNQTLPFVNNDPLPIRVTTTLNDTNQVTKVEYDYEGNNVIEQREYAYGSGAPGSLVRRTDYTWLKVNPVNSQDYTLPGIHILNRKASEKVYDAASNLMAQSQFEYDKYDTSANHAPLQASGAVQRDSAYGTSYTTRAHVTSAQRWRSTDGTWFSAYSQYDDAGNVLKAIDFGLHSTTFSYTDSWANSACAPTSAKAYVTSTTNALTQTTTATYNSCSGTVATTTDPNTRTISFTYDVMGRQTQANFPDTGQATRTFNEPTLPLSITPSIKITSTLNLVPPVTVDGLGRVVQSQLTSDPEGTTYADTTYDALGRKKTVSNPYRSTSDATYGITTFEYDALGRVTKVIPPDGTGTTNNTTTIYSGNCATVTDPAGKKRKTCTDALGRLIQVFEPDAAGNLVIETDYQYDVLNNLLCVHQRGTDATPDKACTDPTVPAAWRPRKFTYNSLSQLLTATNPESGTITYTYDSDGNVLTKMDARSITTTYFYDVLHRLTKKTYSDATPQVTYWYDAQTPTGCSPTLTPTNPIGRRTAMCDAAGAEAWSYDAMGRPLTDKRTTNSVTKTTSYTYNLDGSLATITYPSGRVVTYTSSAAARSLSAVDTAFGINYATSALYSPPGAFSSLQNGSGIVSTFYYNSRLEPCRISVKTTGTAPTQCSDTAHLGNILDLTYDYNLSVANNGNVKQITNNLNTARTQSFTYDEINRVKTALTQGTTGSLCWGLDYSYDVYANLTTVSLDPGRPSCTWTTLNAGISTNNRITNTGFSYDAAGNVLSDGSFSYTWDAESQLKTAAGVTYTYDGDGRRVQKSNGKLYWYGAGGEVIAESDAAGNIADEYVFFGGKRIARRNVSTGNVYYYLADHLGSSRVILQSGQSIPCYDADFDPFGGEHVVTNTCPQNYKFTGKERDAESGLDDFEARYYSSQFGRFHSADWSAIPVPVPYADLGNPQTLNLYAYVKNNPLNLTDPTGHLATGQLGSLEGLSVTPRLPPGNGVAEPYVNVDPPSESALEAMAVNNAIAIAQLEAQQSAQAQRVLIIVGDPGLGRHNQGRNFERAAETRREELKQAGAEAVVARASNIQDFNNALTGNGTLNAVEYFGHASYNKLYVGQSPGPGTNIDISNVTQLSGAKLAANATITIHACYAGSGGRNSIASAIANQLGRTTMAYDGSTRFSSSPKGPDGRAIPPRSGPIYLVPDPGARLVPFRPE